MSSKSHPQKTEAELLNSFFAFKDDEEKFAHEGSLLAGKFLHIIDREINRQKLTRKELAAKVNTSASYITQLLRGDKLPNWSMLAKLSDVLNIEFQIQSNVDEFSDDSLNVQFSMHALEIRKARIACKILEMKHFDSGTDLYNEGRIENILNTVQLDYEDKAIPA